MSGAGRGGGEPSRNGERWIARLMRLYPVEYRRRFGESMSEMLRLRHADARARGFFALALFWLGTLRDALWIGSVERTRALAGDTFALDLRYALRQLVRSPGFAITAVLVTALGVGANTAVFSVADFVLLRSMPYRDADRLVGICEGPRTGPMGWGCQNQISPPNYRDFAEGTTTFSAMGAYAGGAVNLVGGGEPERVSAARVTPEVLPLLGVAPMVGSGLGGDGIGPSASSSGSAYVGGGASLASGESGESGERRVVLSYGLWRSHFGGDPGVVGRTVNLDGVDHVVTGVMPASFQFPSRDVQMWIRLDFSANDLADRGNNWLQLVARLGDGTTMDVARADLLQVADRLARDYPDTNEGTGVSFYLLKDFYSPRFKLMLQALCGATLCILILACANLANLLLARASARERELAVRAALGAGRGRLVRQLITESVVLALLGGVAGSLLAVLSFPLLSLLVPTTLPIAGAPTLNGRVLGLALGFTVLTALGFGILPSLASGGRTALSALRVRAGGGRHRRRAVLVGVEVAASVALLASSGLLVRAMLRVQAVDPGFRSENAVSVRTVLPKLKYASGPARQRFYDEVLAAVRALPGVQAAGYTSGLPTVMTGGIAMVTLPGEEVRPDGEYSVSRRYVTPQLFAALGVPLVQGRDLSDADVNDSARVAVISQALAERHWPNGDPLGRTFLFRGEEWSVVGVVGDMKVRGLERESEPQLYLPSTTVPEGPLDFYDPKDLVIRAGDGAEDLLPEVRRIVRAVDPDQPISDVTTLNDLLAGQTAPRRAQVQVLVALAALALLLSGIGIHGLLAYTVAERKQEIGVRLALGARPEAIAGSIARGGAITVLLGMIPGLLLAYVAGRYMSSMLFGVPVGDMPTVAATVALCAAAALSGALLPALRAVRLSPMTVMRQE